MKTVTKTSVHMENGAANAHHLPDAGDTDTTSSSTVSFSDAEDQPWDSPHDLNNCLGPSFHETASVGSACRASCDCSTDCCCSLQIVVENGMPEISPASKADDTNCRICHLGLDDTPESGVPIQLGCSCKHDLAAAHKQCAETWFKIKGNKVCEICGSTAKNVQVVNEIQIPEQRNEPNDNPPPAPLPPPAESRSLRQGHRLLNFLLACMVFGFIISWLFHFNIPG